MRKKYVLSIMILVSIFCMFVYGDSDKIQDPATGHWYQRFDAPMTWHQAKVYCESLGAHLATITSAEENNFIYLNLAVNPSSWVYECLLGATDEESEGIWKWVTGETWDYTNWGYGEPNNQENEDYLTMLTSFESRFSKWNDRESYFMSSSICEWEGEKITITSPNGGETWVAGSSHPITWTTTGTVGNVKIEYTTDNGSNWATIISSTANTGTYNWTVPNTASSQCKIKISEASTGLPSDTSDVVFSITAAPRIGLSRTKLNFCSLTTGIVTNPQDVSITNSGSGTLNWNISTDAPWLICSPGAGTGNGTILISINSIGLTLGTYTAKVIITDTHAINSPQSVSVTLEVKPGDQYTGAFGDFSTPEDGSIVRSSIPVTGWALDDIGIQSLKIYREEGNSLKFIGDAVFIEGARPDVEAAYPDYPFNYKAGWGYMMLTNFLPGGDGVFKLHAIAVGAGGTITDLGVKTITMDNAHAMKPFGAIDTPTQGGIASGKNFFNIGWVLTPPPNSIPTDGSTIGVWIDGVYIGHPVYNIYREDIAALFPGYANSNAAGGYYTLDTTAYENAIHTIQWTARDSGGNIDGIGSRYFTVLNSSQGSRVTAFNGKGPRLNDDPHGLIPGFRSVLLKKGYNDEINQREIYPDEEGIMHIQSRELERIEIVLKDTPSGYVTGNLLVGDEWRPLPIGTTLDVERGIFYWQPGPGFFGKYHLVFIESDENGPINRKDVIISIGAYEPVEDR